MKNITKLLQCSAYVTLGTVAISAPVFAADIDFANMIAVPVATGAVSAIVAMGAIKIAPGFAKWAVNKVAGMFR